jgi:hypothetical protein
MSKLEKGIRCSFCNKSQDDAKKVISAPSDYSRAYICDECVAVCVEVMDEEDVPKKSKSLYGMEMADLGRMEALGFISLTTMHNLSGSVVDFLLQLKNLLASAKSKLDEIDRAELNEKISNISREILKEGKILEGKKTELERLKKKLASISKVASK